MTKYHTLGALAILMFIFKFCVCEKCNCAWENVHKQPPNLTKLEPLCGKNLTVCDMDSVDKKGDIFCYYVGICLAPIPEDAGAAIIQVKKHEEEWKEKVVIGTLASSSITYADDWMMLHYDGGKKYGSHCNLEERRGMIIMTCKLGEFKGNLRLVTEDREKFSACSYVFELEHDAVCSDQTRQAAKRLSAGSILLITFFTLGGLYLLLGFLYSRCVLNARGYDQIPNKDSWVKLGNLSADGCSFVCRCAERQEQGAYSDLDSERISTPSNSGHSAISAADDDTLLDM